MNPNQQMQEDEDSDYDVFAAVRPKGITVDDNLSDEIQGENLDQQDDDFSSARPTQDSIDRARQQNSQKKSPSTGEIVKDVAKQTGKNLLIGAGGTWGDLATLAGTNKRDAAEIRSTRDFGTLQKWNRGERPTFEQLYMMGSGDEIAPESYSLPTGEGLEEANELLGGPGEAETMAGRYAGRTARLYGSGLPFGQVNPLPAVAGGVLGQTVEEAGGGPLAQAAAEIVGMIVTPTGGVKQLGQHAKKEVAQKIDELRNLGYTDEQITLAINSSRKGKKLGVKASKGSKTEEAFEQFANKSDDLVNDILTSEIHGYEKGSKYVRELANDAYGKVVDEAKNLNLKKLDPFIDVMHKTIEDIRKVVGNKAEAKKFLGELSEDALHVIDNPTAEGIIYFYQRLNALGDWVAPSTRDKMIARVKEAVKDSFKLEGKKGVQLAEEFEKVNQGITRAYKAADVRKVVDKANTQSGYDYSKLYKSFDKPENVKLFEDVLGKTQANNLRQIAKVGKEVKDFDKAWKATGLLKGTGTTLLTNLAYYAYTGNWAAIAAMKGAEAISRKLAEKSLTDPRFQNLLIKGIHAVKAESPKLVQSAINGLQDYLDEEGLELLAPKGNG